MVLKKADIYDETTKKDYRGAPMQKATNQLIINLSPGMLSVALVHRGKIQQAEKVDLDTAQWAGYWDDGLIGLDQSFRQLMSRFPSSHPSKATVFYHSPSLIQKVYTFDLKESQASAAGIAQLRDSVGLNRPVETCLLAQDESSDISTTTLVYSEREEQLRSIYAWLNRCGICANSLVPTSVAAVKVATEAAKGSDADTAIFYLGDDISVFAFHNESGLKIVRSIEIGYRKLIEGYAQGLWPSKLNHEIDSEDQEHTQLDTSDIIKAQSLLFEHGIPMSVFEVEGVELRSAVLPVLAPVLQRVCIEIKQTLRFGLGSDIEMPKHLMLCGPGAAIPHIGKAISQHLDMYIKIDPAESSFEPMNPFGHGTLQWALCKLDSCPNGLLPEIAKDSIARKLLTRCLVAGVAVALLAIGGEYFALSSERQRISQAIEHDSSRIIRVNEYRQNMESASAMSGIIRDVSQLAVETVESIPQWHGPLMMISSLTPDSIRVSELRGDLTQGKPVISINGLALASTEKGASIELNKFVAGLKGIDSVVSVTLGATSRVSIGDDQWGRQFKLDIELLQTALPYQAIVESQANASAGGMP